MPLCAKGEEIHFRGGGETFSATKTATELKFIGQGGHQHQVKIQKCNRKVVDGFWSGLVQNFKAARLTGPTDPKEPEVVYNGVKRRLLSFEESYFYFTKVPKKFRVVQFESKRQCAKKRS